MMRILPEKDFWETPDLLKRISRDTGITYESCRCNTFRHLENLPDCFFKNYKYISNGKGKPSNIIKGNSNKILEFNKNEIYKFLFDNENKNKIVTTFCGYKGNDVKYLLENGWNFINCIEKSPKILNIYKQLKYNSCNYLGDFHDVIYGIKTDILYFDSCSYFNNTKIQKDINIINNLKIEKVFITLQNINNKYCDYNLKNKLTELLYNFIYINERAYVSRTQKMIVFKFEKKVQSL